MPVTEAHEGARNTFIDDRCLDTSMPMITARVDEVTKRRMEKVAQINWSEVIREAIGEKLLQQEYWATADRDRQARAKEETERLRRKVAGWDSAVEIRRWRESAGRGA